MKVIQRWKPKKNPVLVSKTETRWQNFSLSSRSLRLGEKFSCSSRSTRLKERKSRSRLEAWDRKKEILDPVSYTRLKDRYSRPLLESWNRALVGHWVALGGSRTTYVDTHRFTFGFLWCDFTGWSGPLKKCRLIRMSYWRLYYKVGLGMDTKSLGGAMLCCNSTFSAKNGLKIEVQIIFSHLECKIWFPRLTSSSAR